MNKPWSKADLHIHTTYSSDATARVEEVLEYVANHTDLQIIAITDHDTIEGAIKAHRLAKTYGIEVIIGEEVSTINGHILALFLEKPLPPKRPAAETIHAVHEQGGLCIAAHPYGWMVHSLGWNGLQERCHHEWELDGLEGFNASLWLHKNNETAISMGKTLNVALCGGSDSHQLSTLGKGYTLFPGSTAEDLRIAIQTRQTQAAGTPWGWSRILEYLGLKFLDTISDLTTQPFKPSIP